MFSILITTHQSQKTGSSVGVATELRDGRSGIESRWGLDFSPVPTGPVAHPDSCTMGSGSFPGVKCGQGVLLSRHPIYNAEALERVELYLYSA